MPPVKHLAPKIPMAINYCGRQVVRRLGRAVAAYITSRSGACKHNIQHDETPDWRLGCWLGCGKSVV